MPPLTAGSLAGLAAHHLASGKVRELYAVGEGQVLLVATDRVSAYDHVLATEIPDKGAVLTALSLWWFGQLADLVPNHLMTTRVEEYPVELAPYADALRGRSMLCRRLAMLPVECVARGYLAGSGLADYQRSGTVGGIALPPGLQDGSQLPKPIFTPATKAVQGAHDRNVDAQELVEMVGRDDAAELSRLTLAVYQRAATITLARGIALADTKLEFGRAPDGTLLLADEVLTPDSSRLWPADQWRPGRAQPSYDKQYLRDWLVHDSGWDRSGPPPRLPEDVVTATRQRYVEAYEQLTASSFADYLASH